MLSQLGACQSTGHATQGVVWRCSHDRSLQLPGGCIRCGCTSIEVSYQCLLIHSTSAAHTPNRSSGLHTKTKNTLLAAIAMMFIMTTALLGGMLYNVYFITVHYFDTAFDGYWEWDTAVVFNLIQVLAFTVNVRSFFVGLPGSRAHYEFRLSLDKQSFFGTSRDLSVKLRRHSIAT